MKLRTIAVVALVIVALASGGIALAAARGQGGAAARRAEGIVTGRYEMAGGPISRSGKLPPDRPVSGAVRFSAHDRTVLVHVGDSGKFTVRLAPGTYRVTARPSAADGFGGAGCAQPAIVTVRSRRTSHVTMICAVP